MYIIGSVKKKIIIKHIIFYTILIYVIVNSRKKINTYIYIYINSCKNDGSRIIVRQSLVTKLVVTLLNKINITAYFENLTIELHILYTLNTHVKFCINRILFTI